MTPERLVSALFKTTTDVPWYFEPQLSEYALAMAAFTVTGAPRNQQSVNLLANTGGLVGIGRGFGEFHVGVMPVEFVFGWAAQQADAAVPLDPDRGHRWGMDIQPPVDKLDMIRYMRSVTRLRSVGATEIPEHKRWVRVWADMVRVGYAFAKHGPLLLAPDDPSGAQEVTSVRRARYAQIAERWAKDRPAWYDVLMERQALISARRKRKVTKSDV